MAHAQKPDFVFRRNGRVHLNRRGSVSSVDYWQPRCSASAVVMLDTPCYEVVWRVLATHSICEFPLHFPSRASPCAITFQLESTTKFGDPCPRAFQCPVLVAMLCSFCSGDTVKRLVAQYALQLFSTLNCSWKVSKFCFTATAGFILQYR